MNLCQYKDMLGTPGVGFHNHFGTNFAVLDLLGTIGIAYWISTSYKYSFPKTFTGLMCVAIGLHRVFCVNTTLNKMIFGEIDTCEKN